MKKRGTSIVRAKRRRRPIARDNSKPNDMLVELERMLEITYEETR